MLLLLFGFATGTAGTGILGGPRTKKRSLRATLGDGTVELSGLWKFHTGDDLAWAQPNYDDSSWETLDLTPPGGSFKS